jgi:hypothetical protein
MSATTATKKKTLKQFSGGLSPTFTGGRWHSPKQLKESEKEGDQMTTRVCDVCFDYFATLSEALKHSLEHEDKYGIRAIFTCEGKEDRFTYYAEQIFNSEEEALEAINDNYGEELSQAATIDCEIESDLVGYLYEDLEPYTIEKEEIK